jgi:hypothetical protein
MYADFIAQQSEHEFEELEICRARAAREEAVFWRVHDGGRRGARGDAVDGTATRSRMSLGAMS